METWEYLETARELIAANFLDAGVVILLEILDDDEDYSKFEAAEVLLELGLKAPVIKVGLKWLENSDAETRLEAARLLTLTGYADIASVYVSLLKDDSDRVRIEVAGILGYFDSKTTTAPLLDALNDPHEWVRVGAIRSLARQREPLSVQPFLKLLKDKSIEVRFNVVDALRELGDEGLAFTSILQLLKDDDDYTRERAATYLRFFGYEKSIEYLIQALADKKSSVRGSASYAITETIPHDQILEFVKRVKPLLSHDDANIRGSVYDLCNQLMKKYQNIEPGYYTDYSE